MDREGKKKKNCFPCEKSVFISLFFLFNTTKLKASMQQAASDTSRRRTIANELGIWAPSWRPCLLHVSIILSAFRAKQKGDYASGCRKMCGRRNKSPSFDISEQQARLCCSLLSPLISIAQLFNNQNKQIHSVNIWAISPKGLWKMPISS